MKRKILSISIFFILFLNLSISNVLAENSTNLCAGGTPIANASWSDFPPSGAFNGNFNDNGWGSFEYNQDQSNVSWIGYDFGYFIIVGKIVIKHDFWNNVPDGVVLSYKIQSSLDGNNWVTLDAISNEFSGTYEHLLSNKTAYRYYRILCTSNMPTIDFHWMVSEIQMFGFTFYESESVSQLNQLNSNLVLLLAKLNTTIANQEAEKTLITQSEF